MSKELKRKVYKTKFIDNSDSSEGKDVFFDKEEVVGYDKVNLLSSELNNGLHCPVIYLDFQAVCLPSKTSGNYHLYINRSMTWGQYKKLLDGFLGAGLIQKKWYDDAMKDKRSYVSMPMFIILS